MRNNIVWHWCGQGGSKKDATNLKVGDVIVAIDDKLIRQENRVHAILCQLGEPKKIKMEIYRGKKQLSIKVPLLKPAEADTTKG